MGAMLAAKYPHPGLPPYSLGKEAQGTLSAPVLLDPNGAFNVTEFGTVKDKAQFDALYGYSPFHRVKDGTAYPAVILTTGDNDGRVNPAQSRKMIARLQAANPGGRPILLRTSAASGHGIGSSLTETINERTDTFSFLFQQLGVNLRAAR